MLLPPNRGEPRIQQHARVRHRPPPELYYHYCTIYTILYYHYYTTPDLVVLPLNGSKARIQQHARVRYLLLRGALCGSDRLELRPVARRERRLEQRFRLCVRCEWGVD